MSSLGGRSKVRTTSAVTVLEQLEKLLEWLSNDCTCSIKQSLIKAKHLSSLDFKARGSLNDAEHLGHGCSSCIRFKITASYTV